jgi:hypothetical protein
MHKADGRTLTSRWRAAAPSPAANTTSTRTDARLRTRQASTPGFAAIPSSRLPFRHFVHSLRSWFDCVIGCTVVRNIGLLPISSVEQWYVSPPRSSSSPLVDRWFIELCTARRDPHTELGTHIIMQCLVCLTGVSEVPNVLSPNFVSWPKPPLCCLQK